MAVDSGGAAKFEANEWEALINVNGGRSTNGPGIDGGGGTLESGLEAIETDKVFIAEAEAVIIELGTNWEALEPDTIETTFKTSVEQIDRLFLRCLFENHRFFDE